MKAFIHQDLKQYAGAEFKPVPGKSPVMLVLDLEGNVLGSFTTLHLPST